MKNRELREFRMIREQLRNNNNKPTEHGNGVIKAILFSGVIVIITIGILLFILMF